MYLPTDDDSFKRNCVGTKLEFLLWPKKCYATGKILWLRNVYKQTAMWTGPGDPIFEHRYYHTHEFLLQRIRGKV